MEQDLTKRYEDYDRLLEYLDEAPEQFSRAT